MRDSRHFCFKPLFILLAFGVSSISTFLTSVKAASSVATLNLAPRQALNDLASSARADSCKNPDLIIPPSINTFMDRSSGAEPDSGFDFKQQLFGTLSTLSISVQEINTSTGYVVINGGDSRCPTIPFTFDWGDSNSNDGWFPLAHTYANVTRNYVVTVTAHYDGGTTDSAETLVRFVAPTISPVSLTTGVVVMIPDHEVSLSTRLYGIPSDLTYFDDSFFDIVPRSTIEYVLRVAACDQYDFVNSNVFLTNGGFEQVILRDPDFGGMYSLWYTTPVSFAAGDYGFQGTIQYSSFFHEMGHNFTLNSPADYYYGGKIDGSANAIFSETLANIFAHATAYEILNNYHAYGISDDLAFEIKQSAISSITIVRKSYDNYVSSGMHFRSWNDPVTPQDETFDTFMTLAYKFCAHAELAGQGYRIPAERMMKVLQIFNEQIKNQYDPTHDSPEGDTFRATLMVTALSYAFSTDLRPQFRSLNFPISDDIYNNLYRTLYVISKNDSPVPPLGENLFAAGTSVNAYITSPTIDNGTSSRLFCKGWLGAGSVPDSGTTAAVAFSLDEPSTITWQWTTQHYLDATANPPVGGSVTLNDGFTPAAGWHDANTTVTILAVPSSGYEFDNWSGDLSSSNNPESFNMNGPKSIIANFSPVSRINDWIDYW